MTCECYQIGGRFIAEDPDCQEHGAAGIIHSLREALDVALSQAEANRVDAERYRWLKANCGRFPDEYGAPHVRLGENYDYADEESIDRDTDQAMAEQAEEQRLTNAVKTKG